VRKETGKWKSRWKSLDLLADGRCSQAVLDFLSAVDVGRRVVPAEEDTERGVGRGAAGVGGGGGAEAGELGAGEEPLFLPTPSLMASADED